VDAPPQGTVERWAWDYVLCDSLAAKVEPPPVPTAWESSPPSRRIAAPGRPQELVVQSKADKTRGLRNPRARARLLHTFFHHELQAAELMAWAVLAYPSTPLEFRAGLIRIALDEVRHMKMYAQHIARLGSAIGEFPVRDWFWSRVPRCADAASFVAVMGLGLESANLEHSALFAARFRDVGDEEGARLQELVGLEEVAHVRFGTRWFREFTGELDFATWQASLPPPLSPMLMKGEPLQRAARKRAGQTDAFLDELAAWQPEPRGS
jgi:uncharacterized ferritin-like protein (DUF455 family)